MLIVFNTTGRYTTKDNRGDTKVIETLDRDYRQDNCKTKRVYMLEEYGLKPDFMGGNVQMVYELQDSPIRLLVSTKKGFQVYATAVEEKDAKLYLMGLNVVNLKNLAFLYGMKFPSVKTKESIVDEFLEYVYHLVLTKV